MYYTQMHETSAESPEGVVSFPPKRERHLRGGVTFLGNDIRDTFKRFPIVENAFDIVIKNGTVIDGTGTPGKKADLAIKGGKIALVGRLEWPGGRPDGPSVQGCPTVIDATGLVVAPGFIDIHSHSDFLCLVNPRSCLLYTSDAADEN